MVRLLLNDLAGQISQKSVESSVVITLGSKLTFGITAWCGCISTIWTLLCIHMTLLCIHMTNMNFSYVRFDVLICMTWLIHMDDLTLLCVRMTLLCIHMTLLCVHMTLLCVHMTLLCVHKTYWHDMNHFYMRFDVFTCLTHCNTLHIYRWKESFFLHVRFDAFICMTWLIHMYDMTYSFVWHEPSHALHECILLNHLGGVGFLKSHFYSDFV